MLRIQIADWKRYVTRSDLKSVPWIRVPATIGSDRMLHGSVTATRWLYIFLLAEAARQNQEGKLDIAPDYVQHFSGCSLPEIFQSVKFLESRGFLSCRYDDDTDALRIRYESGTDTCTAVTNPIGSVSNGTERNGTERNETQENRTSQNLPPPPPAKAKRSRSKVQVMDLSDDELALGTKWLKYAVHHYPAKVNDRKWTPDSFALELRKVATAIGYSIEQMSQLCDSIAGDTFWCNKAASPFGLLKKSDNGLRKIENAIAGSKSKGQIKSEQRQAKWEQSPEEREAYERGMKLMMEGFKK
jgi:hypothetical protein